MASSYRFFFGNKGRKNSSWILGFFCLSIIIAICQSIRFSSSLWVVAEFGFIEWQEQITQMLSRLLIWALFSGLFFITQFIADSATMDVKKLLKGIAFTFFIGFVSTYLFVCVLGLILYVPLGALSFILPGQIAFTSLGFAFLCAGYIVFFWIALSTPSFLIDIIKNGRLYFKILAILSALLLVVQALSTILSIFFILIENSIWRIHLLAFIIALGVTLVITILINLTFIREELFVKKGVIITGVYFASVITGNISQSLFHWGEYASAFVAAAVAPLAYSMLVNRIQKKNIRLLPVVIGLFGGLSAGSFIVFVTHTKIVAQNWFGIICGSTLVLGFGIAFGLILGPPVGELIVRVFKVRPTNGLFISFGFLIGTMIGFVVGGFANR